MDSLVWLAFMNFGMKSILGAVVAVGEYPLNFRYGEVLFREIFRSFLLFFCFLNLITPFGKIIYG